MDIGRQQMRISIRNSDPGNRRKELLGLVLAAQSQLVEKALDREAEVIEPSTLIPAADSFPIRGKSAEDLTSLQLAEYKRLAGNIIFASSEQHYTLAISSAFFDEGVTTVSVELATVLAYSTTKSVVLVDANLHKPEIHEFFDFSAKPGLKQVLEHRQSLAESLRIADLPNLFILPSGGSFSNPSRLIESDEMVSLVEQLRERYDYVIFDCPAILGDVDASILCKLTDGVALVVRANATPYDEVVKAEGRLERASIIGVILNAVNSNGSKASDWFK